MGNFVVDENRNISAIRSGALIGGIHGQTGANITTNTWYRLMPTGSSAATVTDNPTAINFGSGLRPDVAGSDIRNWRLKILTEGYYGDYVIGEFDAATDIASLQIYNSSGDIQTQLSYLPATFDIVYFPQMLLPLTIGYSTTSTTSTVVQIGYTAEESVTPTNVIHLVTLANGDQLILPIQEIDKIFWRVPADQTDTDVYSFSWGEHYQA